MVRLVAAKGYDAVSIRDITTAARTDVTAVHYHFGSKRDLAAAALQQFLDETAARRAPLLAALRDMPRPTPRDVAECLVVPAAERLRSSAKGRSQNAFVATLVHHAEFADAVQTSLEPDIEVYVAALRRALPGVPPQVLLARLLFSIGVAQHELSQPRSAVPRWHERYGSDGATDPVEALIDYITGGLTGG